MRRRAMTQPRNLRWIAAAALALDPHFALAVSHEHWCAGRGTISNGTQCPEDDSAGPCPPGCEVKTQLCGFSCDGNAAAVAVVASLVVVAVFLAGLLPPLIAGYGAEQAQENVSLQYTNPLTHRDDEAPIAVDEEAPRADGEKPTQE